MSDDLKRYGYAPGRYTCICGRCNGQFIGDKRAITCKACAQVKAAMRALGDIGDRSAYYARILPTPPEGER